MTAKELLEQAPIERYEAEVLLAHLLVCSGVGCSHTETRGSHPMMSKRLWRMPRARATGEPLAYLMGYRDFWSLRLIVDQHVLIPGERPSISLSGRWSALIAGEQKVLDLGTGSGAIALACKSERSDLSITGVDQSEQALACARRNSEALGLGGVLEAGQLVRARRGRGWDLVVSNPPYIAANDVHLGQGDLLRNHSGRWSGGRMP